MTSSWIIPTYSDALQSGAYDQRRCANADHWGVRVILLNEGNVVLVRHHEKTIQQPFWLFPGGGVELGETIIEAGIREVKEETGLDVQIERLVYIREAMKGEIEFYLLASSGVGDLELGTDPEKEVQVLVDVVFMSLEQLRDEKFILYPRTIQQRLEADSHHTWPEALYLGAAQ